MSRHSLHELPMSKTAAWAARIAFFALAVAALSIIIVRSQLLEIVPALATFGAALVLVTKRKWAISDSRAPTLARRDGVIEATARSPIMGFRDDVVIRVAPMGQGTRVDVRPASRVGTHDLGGNASRIRSLLEDIDDVVSSAPEPRQPPQAKTPPSQKGRQPDKRQPAKR